MSRIFGLLLSVAVALSCRGEPPAASSQEMLSRMVDSLRGRVERATGLRFKSPPRSALRTRAQVRAYLLRKLEEELPPSKLEGLETAYRLFGLLPDTLDLRPMLLELYTEQVAGYYDPDSATLFGVAGADPTQLRVVVAHEMVHALQGERIPLDSILHAKSNNDRLAAAQSVLEGQATLAGMKALFPPEIDPTKDPDFWNQYAEQVRGGQASMPVLASAPLVVREALIFPYLAGAQFMHWWERSPFRDSLPYGPRMPVSTEQVLFPDRYARRDVPVSLQFPADTTVLYEDVLGESEVRILMARLGGSDKVTARGPVGWGGDRYRVHRTPGGPALVWWVVWDDRQSGERFVTDYGAKLRATERKGYRAAVESLEVDGSPAIRYVLAPAGWNGWSDLPHASVAR
jgi:AcrR family transcriptional regulator